MTQCPSCHQHVEIGSQYFGTLFNCPRCNAVYFVDWDGKPEAQVQHESLPVEDPAPEMPAEEMQVTPAESTQDPFAQVVEPMAAQELIAEQEPMAAQEPIAEQPSESSQDFTFENSFNSVSAVNSAPGETFQDIQEFGNTDTSQILTYTLRIQGLELKDIQDQVLDAMTDSRFAWNVEEIAATISDGTLELSKLNPVKAAVLVSRLKSLPVQIEWSQHALTEV